MRTKTSVKFVNKATNDIFIFMLERISLGLVMKTIERGKLKLKTAKRYLKRFHCKHC